MSTPDVHVLGRFPPPLDGQSVATARLATLLERTGRTVSQVRTGAPEGDHVVQPGRVDAGRVAHYLRSREDVRRALRSAPTAPVLWPAISPSPLGHARDLLSIAPGFQLGQPVVGVVHRGDFERLFASPWTSVTGRRLVRRLAAVVFLTERLATMCAPYIPDGKRLVIPNSISDDVIPSAEAVEAKWAARATRPPVDPLRLLYLSGMIPSKGYGTVLDATATLRDRGVPVRTTFAGRWESAEAEAAFADRVRALDLGPYVDVRGGVGREDAAALHLDADLFLLPTEYPAEAQPLVVIEALAAGTPVLVTRHAGLPEMVADGREGLFVPPRDPGALADAVETASQPDRWPALARAARARFEAAYSPAAVQAQWEALLGTLRSEGAFPDSAHRTRP